MVGRGGGSLVLEGLLLLDGHYFQNLLGAEALWHNFQRLPLLGIINSHHFLMLLSAIATFGQSLLSEVYS